MFDGDIINIDGIGMLCDFYFCWNEKGLDLIGLVLCSYKSWLFILCRINGFWFFCGIVFWGVFLEEIIFVNILIYFFECFLNMVVCSFINSFVFIFILKYYVYFMRNV